MVFFPPELTKFAVVATTNISSKRQERREVEREREREIVRERGGREGGMIMQVLKFTNVKEVPVLALQGL